LICEGLSIFSTIHSFTIQKETVPYEIVATGNIMISLSVCIFLYEILKSFYYKVKIDNEIIVEASILGDITPDTPRYGRAMI
jgi:hypothetical protein